MVPLLTLGIPGPAATAVLIWGFLMWGLQPGPLLMEQNPEFAWGLIASMYLGNVMLLVINIAMVVIVAVPLLAPHLCRLVAARIEEVGRRRAETREDQRTNR